MDVEWALVGGNTFHFGLNLCHLLFFTYPFLKHN